MIGQVSGNQADAGQVCLAKIRTNLRLIIAHAASELDWMNERAKKNKNIFVRDFELVRCDEVVRDSIPLTGQKSSGPAT